VDKKARLVVGWLNVQTSHRELEADAVRRRDENRPPTRFAGTGRDALASVWTVAYHSDVVASLRDVRRRFARGRQQSGGRDEVKQGEIECLAW